MSLLFGISAVRTGAALLLATGLTAFGCSRESGMTGSRGSALRDDTQTRAGVAAVGAQLESYLSAAEKRWGFQGSVLVARGNEAVLEKGLGLADLEKGLPIVPETKFQIASVTKVFTAVAVMKLVEDGKIGLDEPAARYLPEYKDILGQDITIGHLLSHSSGLPALPPGSAGRLNVTEPVEPRALIDAIRGQGPLFPPGREARYSNIGYVLLGLAIEKVTGEGYYDWLGGHVLEPLEMNDTGMNASYPALLGFARGYVEDRGGTLRPAPFIHPTWGYSAGALYSTGEDLRKFDRALASPGFLTAGSLDEMFRPRNRTFSYGWLVGRAFGRRTEAHGGGGPGFSAWIERWPEDEVFVAVLSNVTSSPAGEIGRGLAAAVFGRAFAMPGKRIPVPVPPAELKEFEGGYRLEDGEIRRIVLEGGGLFVSRGDGPKQPILPYAQDRFFFAMDKGAFIRFVRDARGRVTGHIFHQLGVDEPAQRI